MRTVFICAAGQPFGNQRSEQTLHFAIDRYNEALKKDAGFGLRLLRPS